MEVLNKAALKEQYWSVRAESARSIGKIGGKQALETLLDSAPSRHRRVRRGSSRGARRVQGRRRCPGGTQGRPLP